MVALSRMPDRQQTLSAVLRSRIDWLLLGLDATTMLVISVLVHLDEGGYAEAVGIVGVALTLVSLEVAGLYRSRLTLSALDDLPRLAAWSIISSGTVLAVARPGESITRTAAYATLVFVALFVVRTAYYIFVRRRRRRSPAVRMRAMVVGDGLVSVELIKNTRALPELGLDVVVAVSDSPMSELVDTRVRVEGGAILDKAVEHDIDIVLVSFGSAPDSRLVGPLRACDELDCEIFIVPRLYEFVSLTPTMDRIHTIPLVRVRRDALRTWYWKLKRVFDVTVVSLALAVLAIPMALVALGVFLSDPSAPILFRQRRIGRDGQLFDMLKFRSMRPATETASDSQWQPTDRIYPLGKLMRKTSIDELPQLWNVLRGDMSIVGPRPERPHFVEQFESSVPRYGDRHRVDVGLTGWAAVHGLRGDTSISDRAAYDNFYIENWSVWLDIKIIVRTVGAVLRGSGS
ncbi:MAG TPA: exopolysaccharide biosynthesis polyprenyl glycosylphosphotransferase [Gordonia sp. (in: high G+C Gram-positive bacteria)]|jgi:exopolysaccharide biosynthesis polyprenyl glycosylphosphotransferase|uniref:exopolysaccharide biosynthesis polyprenyl glycosylphosphotransferase n=1 Tax=Gordonia sp. (in: high G+C Gram-positive bacteria) TaxID=84139 RepID=UPI0025BB9044|nr:exopolysaccharide biosynthesis polyprenyl glycosylphosphotransferase [Gordonia sp. (in: high G+C Gram-positive bacteria)]HQV17759.1 exopolysaccharide biosynthesis polyprenyl glycosylphosphotransferase [Gordonia sp. (in: high G+C Gram-positive bacteria)]